MADYLLYAAGILLVIAMLMPGIRWLRIIALAGGIAAMAHFAFFSPNWIGLVWALIFILANTAQLLILLNRSRRHLMRPEERDLLEHVLQVQEPSDQRRLLDLMEWTDVEAGTILMEQGQRRPPLIYVVSGAAAIEHDGGIVGVCGPRDFLGEMSLITGEPASATVRVSNPMRIARFDRDSLGQLTHSMPEISRAFDAALNRGLAAKVLRMNEAASGNER